MSKTFLMPLVFSSTIAFALAACDKADGSDKHSGHGDHAMDGAHAAHGEAIEAAEAAPSDPIAITVDGQGFQPNRVEVQSGNAATLRFTRTSDDTCAKDVVFPELDIKKPLPLNTPVDVAVPATEARTLTFQCGMGMYKSQVVING